MRAAMVRDRADIRHRAVIGSAHTKRHVTGGDTPVGVLGLGGQRCSIWSTWRRRGGTALPVVHAQQHGVARGVLVEAGAQTAQDQLRCHVDRC